MPGTVCGVNESLEECVGTCEDQRQQFSLFLFWLFIPPVCMCGLLTAVVGGKKNLHLLPDCTFELILPEGIDIVICSEANITFNKKSVNEA